jgi:hypothetical protein
MNLTLEIPPELQTRLKTEAERRGMNEADFAKQLLDRNLPPVSPAIDRATLDLLAQWDREDQTEDAEEIARRNRDFEELKEGLNRNRAESGGPGARRVFP